MNSEGPNAGEKPAPSSPGVRLARVYIGSIVLAGILFAIDGEPIDWLYALGASGVLGAYFLLLYLLDRRRQT